MANRVRDGNRVWTFTLVLEPGGTTAEALEDALFEAGCDDAIVVATQGSTYVEFDRESGSLEAAILSAIQDISSAEMSIRISHVEPGDLVTAAEMARRLDCSREYIRLLACGERGSGEFPSPVSGVTGKTAIWSWCAVLRWAADQDRLTDPAALEAAVVIRDLNAALNSLRDPAAQRRSNALSRRLRRAIPSRRVS